MTALMAFALAGALWAGTPAPPADMPADQVTRAALPEPHDNLFTSTHWAVACAHHLAANAGERILRGGGNAADAAVAVQAALAVVEPESSGPGGGCFILYHDMATDSLFAFDGREELPRAGFPTMFLEEDGRIKEECWSGGLSVGVPGTIAAMSRLHARFGSMPLDSVLAPAIELAEGGFPVSGDLARAIRSERRRLERFPASRAIYFDGDGEPWDEFDRIANPELGAFLRRWAADPSGRFFYEGEVAAAIVAAVRESSFHPGLLDAEDLANYRAVRREPIVGSYRGRDIAVFPPPTSGGLTLLEILGILERQPPLRGDIRRDDDLLVEHLDRLARASRVAFADRNAYLGDRDWSQDVEMDVLMNEDFLDARAVDAFLPGADLSPGAEPAAVEGYQTTHFSVIDSDGSMLSCTSTIETTFGCAMVVPGQGFLLNNELTDFNLVPADPPAPNDIEGGRRPRATAIDAEPGEGGKRPRSSMCPVIVYGDGRPAMALGSPGGSRIIGTVASVLLLVLDHELNMQRAIDFPRLHCRDLPVEIETYGWNREAVADAMRARGWEIAPLQGWPLLQGDVHAVGIGQGGRIESATDPRHDGGRAGG